MSNSPDSLPKRDRNAGRYPQFSKEYRQRWIAGGNWGDRTLHDLFDESVAEGPDDVALITAACRYSFSEFK